MHWFSKIHIIHQIHFNQSQLSSIPNWDHSAYSTKRNILDDRIIGWLHPHILPVPSPQQKKNPPRNHGLVYKRFTRTYTYLGHTVDGCEIRITSWKRWWASNCIFIGFQPSFWWCRISQPSRVEKGCLNIGRMGFVESQCFGPQLEAAGRGMAGADAAHAAHAAHKAWRRRCLSPEANGWIYRG